MSGDERRTGGGHESGRPRETELKLALDPALAERLWRHPLWKAHAPSRTVSRQLRAIYFDTPDLQLARAGVELRVRRQGRQNIQAVKARGAYAAGLVQRDELEVPVPEALPHAVPVPERIADAALRRLVEQAVAEGLAPIFETDIRRWERSITYGGGRMTLCLDRGAVRVGEKQSPLCELEIELVDGPVGLVFDLAQELLTHVPLRVAHGGKSKRGYDLLLDRQPRPEKAEKPALSRQMMLEDVLALSVRSCLKQILANEVIVCQGDDPEGVHQMRVGLRRLRSLFTVFTPVLPAAQTEHFKAELKWLAGELGTARDYDVFRDEIVRPVQARFSTAPGMAGLLKDADLVGAQAYERARAAIADRRYTRLLLDLSRWIAEAGWREQNLTETGAQLFAPARDFADALLEQRGRKLRKNGKRLLAGPPADRHLLRIHVKKMRYAAEFFSELYPRKKTGPYLKRLAALQEVLGHMNDVAVAENLLLPKEGAGNSGKDAQRNVQRGHAVGLVLGWHGRAAWEHGRELDKLWRRLQASDSFWRKPSASDRL